jgi:hypothetical protein
MLPPLFTPDMIGNQYTNITTTTTTVVKSGPGCLAGIVINTPVALAVITIYDNTAGSGTKIGTITFPAVLITGAQHIPFGVQFRTGLTIVTSGAAANITPVFS